MLLADIIIVGRDIDAFALEILRISREPSGFGNGARATWVADGYLANRENSLPQRGQARLSSVFMGLSVFQM